MRLPEAVWWRVRQNPRFGLLVVASIALGVGVNTSVFSAFSQLVLRPIPALALERLVVVYVTGQSMKGQEAPVSYPLVEEWRRDNTVFETLSVSIAESVDISEEASTRRLRAAFVSFQYLEMLGVRAIKGRLFSDSESRGLREERVAVMSERFWASQFGREPSAVGRGVRLDGVGLTIIGVASSVDRAWPHDPPDVFLPLGLVPAMRSPALLQEPGNLVCRVVGRLRNGVSVPAAQAALSTLHRRLAKTHPDLAEDLEPLVVPLSSDLVHPRVRTALVLLQGVGLMVLLIAAANVAGLMRLDGMTRAVETAVRMAVGASPSRVGGEFVGVAVFLGAVGGLAAVIVAYSANMLLESTAEAAVTGATFRLDRTSLLVSLALATGVGFGAGLWPAVVAARRRPAEVLRGGMSSAGGGGAGRRNRRAAATVFQVATATFLLVGALGTLRDIRRVLASPKGFRPEGLVSARLGLPDRYSSEEVNAFSEALTETLGSQPGIKAVALGSDLPFPNPGGTVSVSVDGGPRLLNTGAVPTPGAHYVGPGYLEVLGVPLLTGRAFTRADDLASALVAIVNQTMARQYWDSGAALGRSVKLRQDSDPIEIVGVVGDVKYGSLRRRTGPEMYLPLRQWPRRELYVVARSDRARVEDTAVSLRKGIWSIDPTVPAFDVKTLPERIREASGVERLAATLIGCSSALAVVLAAGGVYGLVLRSATARIREVGIRMALGAPRGSVVGLFVAQGLRAAIGGLGLGILLAIWVAKVVSINVFGLELALFESSALAVVLMMVVVTTSSLAAAIPASAVDPVRALHDS